MNTSDHKFFFRAFAFAIIAIVLSAVFFSVRMQQGDTIEHVNTFQENFITKDKQITLALDDFTQMVNDRMPDAYTNLMEHGLPDQLIEMYSRKGLSFFIVSNDSIRFWTDHTVPFTPDQIPPVSCGALRLKNGWYYFRQYAKEDMTCLVFYVIRYEFRYQNRFLVNGFFDDYQMPEDVFFISTRPEDGYPIHTSEGLYAFSLNPRRESNLMETNQWLLAISRILAIAGMLMLFFFSFRYFSKLFSVHSKPLAIAGFVGSMVLLRFLSFTFGIPSVFYDGQLFSPAMYATSAMLPSLGDLLINSLVFSVISFFLFVHLRYFAFRGPVSKHIRTVLVFFIFLLIYLFCNLAVFLIRGLVINSNLNLDVNFIFNLDIYSLVGFMIIGSIFFSFFFLSVVLFRIALNLLKKQSDLWMVYLGSLAIIILWHWVLIGPAPLQWMLFVSGIFVFEMERKSISPQAGFFSLVVSLFLFSLISSIALYKFNREKDNERRITLALQMASEQDPVAEFLFLEIEETLFSDHQLKNLVWNDPYNESAVYRYLQHHYFYDFWAKYDLQVTICQPRELLLLKPSNVQVICADFFDDLIETFGKPTISNQLIYLDNNTGRNSYICKIPVRMGENEDHPVDYFIYIEFDSKYVARDMGFPELLVDDRIDINRDLVNYSYATYKDGVLINKSGPYNYSVHVNAYDFAGNEFTNFALGGYKHLLFSKDDTTQIIISRPKPTILEQVAPFSYLFILFFVLIVIFYLMTSQKRYTTFLHLTFKRRVQVSMITIVIVSALAIGGASTWFILNISNNKNMAMLDEKAHGVLAETELSIDFMDISAFDASMQAFLSDLLLKQSNVFFTDINLFDIHGQLIASSRPKVFEEGLVSTQMHPVAFANLSGQLSNQYVHNERIGNLEYLSAYILLRNQYQELLGYINLPYFAKQGELRDEISYFLVAFVNIYLLLFVVAIVVALFISNFVTQPLQLIRENLSRIQLGRTNQKIEWPRKDEIGSLIAEYNRMIDELGASAEWLARSERETAWREMAKQVAHEIKNPLTPMRLNIQYLEKAWKEGAPDWNERLERFSKTMIEQIDNLAAIAGAFSDFAQMPHGNNVELDLRSYIPEVLNLYNDQDRLQMNLDMPVGSEPLVVMADRNQLNRVFNNLINNAIQAYGKTETARVDVSCYAESGFFRVEIKDYGCGIPQNLKGNIFSPNFTTKTSGMGLGLSIVKNIIENLGGRVAFHSIEAQGSIFSFTLPVI
jgi:two-component system, NtrC family, nitrogen regulation sensor histidine kinase NtrY